MQKDKATDICNGAATQNCGEAVRFLSVKRKF